MSQQLQLAPATQAVPAALQNQYFANWNPCSAQTVMFTPGSPFYPGSACTCQQSKKCCCKKRKKKKKKKKSVEYVYMKPPSESEFFVCLSCYSVAMLSCNYGDKMTKNSDFRPALSLRNKDADTYILCCVTLKVTAIRPTHHSPIKALRFIFGREGVRKAPRSRCHYVSM